MMYLGCDVENKLLRLSKRLEFVLAIHRMLCCHYINVRVWLMSITSNKVEWNWI